MSGTVSILWLRQDLRLSDQRALVAAVSEGGVVPVYILDDETMSPERRMGGASRWWLHHSLAALAKALEAKGSRLILRKGRSADVIAKLAAELGTRRVHALRHYEPWWKAAEAEVARHLDLALHDGVTLVRPESVLNGTGGRYRIFTPWWNALKVQMPPAKPVPAPEAIPAPAAWPASDALESWGLLPTKPNWAIGFEAEWVPGEAGAHARLADMLPRLGAYDHDRNFPSLEGTARLSPHLHFGEISSATVWYRCAAHAHAVAEPFLREIGWHDFGIGVIDQYPDYHLKNGRPQFDAFPWIEGEAADHAFEAWRLGRTGYPIVDAGMRQLWATGWMHNRVRMIVASFLMKHLLVDWRRGEQWFWDTLVDANHGVNAQNWQWVSGTGVDSAPYYRIMAPLTQSEKFDAGSYIRRWVPELAHIRGETIHDPHSYGTAPSGYPIPIVNHRFARERALAAGKGL